MLERRIERDALFEAQLRDIAKLDRAYYLNPKPSAAERASYHLRHDYLEEVRRHFYTESRTPAFSIQVDDRANARQVVSQPQCRLRHDVNNDLGVLLGRCQLLEDLVADQPSAMKQLAEINASARKIAGRFKEQCVQEFLKTAR